MSSHHYARCIFCEQTDSPQHNEDILGKWLARELATLAGTKPEYLARTGKFGDDGWPFFEYGAKGKLGWLTKGPCQRCNNGFMSKLEDATKPLLMPLLKGEPCHPTAEDLRIIAQWTLKTTILYEHMHYTAGRFFSKGHRRAFYKSRAIPPDTFMYAARYLGDSATHAIGGPVRIRFPNLATELDAYCSTIAVGQVALQVFSIKRPEVVRQTLNIDIPARWADVHRPIWPVALAGWRWPPSIALRDNNELEGFAVRMLRTYRGVPLRPHP